MILQKPTIDVIIVNWNTGRQIQECLLSLSHATQDSYLLGRVIIVDNASTDNSASGLHCPGLPLTLIQNSSNRGFAVACNQGAVRSTADYLLFLNPDTRLLPDTLTKSVECMVKLESSKIGILGVQLLEKAGEVSRSCSRFPTAKIFISNMLGLNKLFPRLFPTQFCLEWDHLQSRAVDHVMGAYFFMRSDVFREANGFDERFFVYIEDVDLSLRVRKLGWSTYYLATAQCYHSGGGSSKHVKAMRLFYALRSRIFYGFKNYGMGSSVTLLLATLFIEPVARIGRAILWGSISQVGEVAIAYLRLWQALPEILTSQYLRKPETLKLDPEVWR
jgi:N-acetylglucosaminyl-diphospho-decaprenol L-rhamnosyltransferase